MKKILIMCTGNSCRSIIAEALIKKYLNEVQVYSCGTNPTGKINKYAKKVLKEYKCWREDLYSKHFKDIKVENFDLVVTVCNSAKESCPVFTNGTKMIHIGFDDPDGKEYDEFKKTYQDIKNRLLPTVKNHLNS